MVDSGPVEAGEFDVVLTKNWAEMSNAQNKTKEYLAANQVKILDGGLPVAVYYNPKLDINRFFIDDSSSGNPPPDLPKVEQGRGEDAGADGDKDDLFEDQLEDALCVFKSGGGAAGKDADIL